MVWPERRWGPTIARTSANRAPWDERIARKGESRPATRVDVRMRVEDLAPAAQIDFDTSLKHPTEGHARPCAAGSARVQERDAALDSAPVNVRTRAAISEI